jgi:citrate synthase
MHDAKANADYLSRDQVLERLGIKQQTLYAYVSRGFIRSIAHPDGRSSLYAREDVEKVRQRSALRTNWPVFESSITEITEDGPRYRGRLAVDLARARVRFENVAEFLWDGELAEEPIAWGRQRDPRALGGLLKSAARLHPESHVVQLMTVGISALGISAGVRRERIRAGLTPIVSARGVMRALGGIMGFLGAEKRYAPLEDGEALAAAVARRLGSSDSETINAALIVVGDHELNPATFAARVAASGNSDLHSCIGAALNTHYGTSVGRACDRLEGLFTPQSGAAEMMARASRMLDASRSLPGFNHPLYPDGDPRARFLRELAVAVGGPRPAVRDILVVLSQLENEYGLVPSVECGLVLLCRALGLPERSAAGLYALGRTAGWVAHVLEQRLAGFVIRPRARYAAT